MFCPDCGTWNRSAAKACAKCAALLPEVRAAAEVPDGVITVLRQAMGNRYRIIRRLGSGGMADVYAAEHEQLGRPLAVKVMHAHLARDAEMRVRFRREAEAASRLLHPLICTPIDYGDVCVNYDRAYFADGEERAIPQTLDDLAEPQFAKLLVVENPATSSTGLAFMLASIARYGEAGWRDWWAKLRAGGVKVVDGWEQAYNTEFSGSAGKGAYPLVVSYATSPPAEVIYADPKPSTAPTGNLDRTCFRQVETVGVLRNAEHPAAARRLVDFMLGEQFQEDVPLSMFVYPVRPGTPVPPEFTQYAGKPTDPFRVPPARITAHRDQWLEQWNADRKSTRLNSSHVALSRMPSSA